MTKGGKFQKRKSFNYPESFLYCLCSSNYTSFFFSLKGPDFELSPDESEEDELEIRVVLTAPHRDLPLETEDIAFMLVQYDNEAEEQNKQHQM